MPPKPTTSEDLRSLLQAQKLEPYIKHVRFPRYKNLAPDLEVQFSFPVAALVGVNGTNKSSILRALQGAPGNANLGNYWFSTSTDSIQQTTERPNCFIYGYQHPGASKVVEVLKTRVNKESDPDYWEPSRPIAAYGMPPFDKSAPKNVGKTRWDTITKSVVYIDFRQTLSAFDRSFYYDWGRTQARLPERKHFLRTRSKRVKEVIASGATTYSYFGSERIIEKVNRKLNDEELAAVSFILGRDYESINWIRHDFFNVIGFTCIMKAGQLNYTEAFAGSGEFAVVRLVVELVGAPDHSLILLDEPEVSLHPGAQDRLVSFLFQKVKEHKHQVIMSTHSPAMIRRLPPDAIKVLVVDQATGVVRLPSQSATSEEAFFYLGEPVPGRITVVVEDELAKHIVTKALRTGGEAFASRFKVEQFPGGASTLWQSYMPAYAAEERQDVFVLLDGDQQPSEALPDPQTVAAAHFNVLRAALKAVSGVEIKFHTDGGAQGGNQQQLESMVRNFVKWARAHVSYLPGSRPEEFVWQHMKPDEMSDSLNGITDSKERFKKLARLELGRADYEPLSSQDILQTQLRRLASISNDLPQLQTLLQKLQAIAKDAKTS